jgi:hypothetical protein
MRKFWLGAASFTVGCLLAFIGVAGSLLILFTVAALTRFGSLLPSDPGGLTINRFVILGAWGYLTQLFTRQIYRHWTIRKEGAQ